MSDSESEPFCPCPACAIEGAKSLVWKVLGFSATKNPPKNHSAIVVTPKTPAHESGKPASKDKEQVLNPGTDASSQSSAKGFLKDAPKKGPSKPSTGTPAQPALKELSIKNNSNTTVTPVAPTKDPVESAPKAVPKRNPNIKSATLIPVRYPVESTLKDNPEHNPDVTAAPLISTQDSLKSATKIAPKHISDPSVAPVIPTQSQLKLKVTLGGFTSSTGRDLGPDASHTRDPDKPGSISPGSIKEQASGSSSGTSINYTQKPRDPQVKTEMSPDVKPVSIAKPTEDECLTRLRKHIAEEKADLADNFFQKGLTEFGGGATKMVSSLMDAGCTKREIAMDLSVLTLYNLVIFIDDSPSMGSKANEAILTNTLNEICKIYSLANETGIQSVRYLNHRQGKGNVGLKDVKEVISRCAHTGVTRIGTELHRRVLSTLVLNPKVPMSKPLLVIIVTDGTVEGESDTLLPKVIINCVASLQKAGKSHQSVAFQFCRIGNDPEAIKFLKDLDNHPKLGDHIDCLSEHFHLENISDDEKWLKERWNVMCKLLLGPLIPHWDNYDKPIDEDNLENDEGLSLKNDNEGMLDDD